MKRVIHVFSESTTRGHSRFVHVKDNCLDVKIWEIVCDVRICVLMQWSKWSDMLWNCFSDNCLSFPFTQFSLTPSSFCLYPSFLYFLYTFDATFPPPCHPAGSSSVPEFFRIMSRQFTAYEWIVIQSAGSEEEQLAAFYRHWVSTATVLPCHPIVSLPGPSGSF